MIFLVSFFSSTLPILLRSRPLYGFRVPTIIRTFYDHHRPTGVIRRIGIRKQLIFPDRRTCRNVHSPTAQRRTSERNIMTLQQQGTSTVRDATTHEEEKHNDDDDEEEEDHQHTTPIVPRKFIPFPFPYHHTLILRVESLTNLGLGICRVNITTHGDAQRKEDVRESLRIVEDGPQSSSQEEGGSSSTWVVMIPNVIPGELVKGRIYRNHGKYSDADLMEILEAHPMRVSPQCPLASECGGCQYQHMHISLQREWKSAHVQDLFIRIGKFRPDAIPNVLPTLGTEHVYHYRSKITPHYDAPDKNKKVGGAMIHVGFQKKTSRQIVDVPYCHIATEAMNQKLQQVRADLFTSIQGKKLKKMNKGATILLRDAFEYHEHSDGTFDTSMRQENKIKNKNYKPVVETNPNTYVQTQVHQLTFRFLAGNFFQNNPFMLPLMVDHVIQASIHPNFMGESMTHFIDCYCGSGLFCLSAASKFQFCVGIEVNEKAVQEARINAQLNHIENCKFVAASAEAIFESQHPLQFQQGHTNTKEPSTSIYVQDFPRDRTVVVLDPPRKGCSPEFLEQMFVYQPQRIVYMSCDPATQARDAQSIVAAGYKITSILPFDLFPQTRHIECLAIFERIHTI